MLKKRLKITALERKGILILGDDLNLIMCPKMDTESNRQQSAFPAAKASRIDRGDR